MQSFFEGNRNQSTLAKRLRQLFSPTFFFYASQAVCKPQKFIYLHKLNEQKLPFKKLLLLIFLLSETYEDPQSILTPRLPSMIFPVLMSTYISAEPKSSSLRKSHCELAATIEQSLEVFMKPDL